MKNHKISKKDRKKEHKREKESSELCCVSLKEDACGCYLDSSESVCMSSSCGCYADPCGNTYISASCCC